ncbi:hypothetical protein GCM10007164_25450 [Luteimonas padinae]|nr:hypothetical protein GCM10007164_25450 [Luteimonas padinae]
MAGPGRLSALARHRLRDQRDAPADAIQRMTAFGERGVEPRVGLEQARAAHSFVVAQQRGAQDPVALGGAERVEEGADDRPRRERVGRSHVSAQRGGHRPEAAVDDAQHVGETALQRLDRRLPDQLRVQLAVRHQGEVAGERRGIGRRGPTGEAGRQMLLPAALVAAGVVLQHDGIGQRLREFVIGRARRQAPQLGFGGLPRHCQQRLEPGPEPLVEGLELPRRLRHGRCPGRTCSGTG